MKQLMSLEKVAPLWATGAYQRNHYAEPSILQNGDARRAGGLQQVGTEADPFLADRLNSARSSKRNSARSHGTPVFFCFLLCEVLHQCTPVVAAFLLRMSLLSDSIFVGRCEPDKSPASVDSSSMLMVAPATLMSHFDFLCHSVDSRSYSVTNEVLSPTLST